MPITTNGTSLSPQVSFNAGTLDINGYEIAVLQNITVALEFSQKDIRQLGSIIMATAPKRYGFKTSCKAKVKSINKELYGILMGSSGTDGSGFAYNVVDGQNVLSRATVNVIMNDDSTKTVQFQFTNAILAGAFSLGLKLEDAAELDFEIYAQNVTVVTNFTAV